MTRLTAVALLALGAGSLAAQQDSVQLSLRDRGPGIRTSEFQTYIQRGQFFIIPSASYMKDHNFEYNPIDWGFGQQADLRGTFHGSSGQLFLAYGVNDWLALEVEGSYLDAQFERSPQDTTATPQQINESGFGDFAVQARLRFVKEKRSRPEIWGSLEFIPAANQDKVLIGDKQSDLKGEIGFTRGYQFGTMTFKTTIEYNHGDHHWDLGETSIEYLRQLSLNWRLMAAVEGGEGGAPDEFVFVTSFQARLARRAVLNFGNSFGLMSKSTDLEPYIGVRLELP
jgi:hypothetical protein